jgi:hypothetical protein
MRPEPKVILKEAPVPRSIKLYFDTHRAVSPR